MADSDVIGGIENLKSAVSGETPAYQYKDPNTDMMKAIGKCIDAADGTIDDQYEYKNPNTDVIKKMDELAVAISEGGGGGSNLDSILEAGIVSTGSDYATATFDDISDYTQIICRLYKDGDFYYQILNVNDIPEIGELNSNFMSPTGADFSISRTSVRLTYYTGGFRTIYMDIVGSKGIIFQHVYT